MSATAVAAGVAIPRAVATVAAVSPAKHRSLNDLFVVANSLVLIGSFFWVPAGAYVFYKKYCTTRKRKLAFAAVLAAIIMVPLPECRRVTRLRIWRMFLRYFSGRAVGHLSKDAGDHQQQALYCLVPHGIFPFGIAFAALSDFHESVFNSARPIVANGILHMPVIGHILRMLGAVRASPKAVKAALDKGLSLSLAPGGIGEMFWGYPRPGCSPDSEYAMLKGRLGFIKRAMESGVAVVPVYVFGNSKTFKRVQLPQMFEELSRVLKASIMLFWGRWGLPVPFKVPLVFAVGKPIPVPKVVNPTDEQVRELHAKFCKALVSLFDHYKAEYGWARKTLELV
ncbi:mono-or diacylglycerol acyltransferase type 2 [Tribonema minus]|uniref:Acyltransferase n=1 Tax=Tribonema minus TaxID=303371 RepID=A0A835Z925_9STRA|nr:mono-or diacylglycerol acyltransferase type 2 [Tribonema minus]